MHADALYYPYPSRRNVVCASRGMVATSQPLAAQAGLHILRSGGNAVDAAVATAACLTVVEPTCNGMGGDAFAQVWMADAQGGALHGLNSSGPSPALLSLDKVLHAGHKSMPHDGVFPVTVPGIPAAWAALNKRFGRLPLTQCLEPAISYAEQGFAVAPVTATLWEHAYKHYAASEDAALRHWFAAFAPKGRAPRPGELWRFPEQARTLQTIAESGAEAFYKGPLAERIDQFMREVGGYLRGTDMTDFAPQWVEPVSMEYRGLDVWELPPNGHGLVVLMALNILKNFDMSAADTPETQHRLMEAVKLAFADGLTHIADPAHMRVTVEELLAPEYGQERAALLGDKALDPAPGQPHAGGTVYLATADGEGNMVSYIQSNYTGFGSGLVVPGTGIALQNRGACFSTDPAHPNAVAPGKRPYHTIIPGFLTRHGKPVGSGPPGSFGPFGPFGMMGGFIQPQGHVMLMHRILDQGLNPQAALDAPRFRWVRGRTVEVECAYPAALAEALQRRGHDVRYGTVDDRDFGRGQIIWRVEEEDEASFYMGGTEPRTDGQVAAF